MALGGGSRGLVPADWRHPVAVFAILFSLYAATAPRSVIMEDDGLFILSSYFLGVEHPPGYPLFVWIGHLFTLLPFGSVAYRVHLVSALFGALACAVLWLCARALGQGRLSAWLAALVLGASPVFWSQSLIADVYSLNAFFVVLLLCLALRACPPDTAQRQEAHARQLLPWISLVFGLSLANHGPLMLLVAPGLAILLWPLRYEMLRRAWLLVPLVMLGLLPYVWIVYRSRMDPVISFAGPLETPAEIWHFLSRAGYEQVDHSVSANWLDRVKFFRFLGGQLLYQFAVIGTLLAVSGFAVQWRTLGRRTAAGLTLAFLGPTVVLLSMLDFDYSDWSAHMFHVYPLPAYAVAALWLGLGFAWVVEHYALRRAAAAGAAAVVSAAVFALGAQENLQANYGWVRSYADAVLSTLPAGAVLVAEGEADLAPLAYLHMVEHRRPDITLYQSEGLILRNRLFHPLRLDWALRQRAFDDMIERQAVPVAFTPLAIDRIGAHAQRDHWLYVEVDKSSVDPKRVTVEVPARLQQFFEQSVARGDTSNAWMANVQNVLRKRYGLLLGRSLSRDHPPTPRIRRHLELLEHDYYGALGLAEGLMLNPKGYSVGAVVGLLDSARARMPSNAMKPYQAQFFYLRGALRMNVHDANGAMEDFDTSLSVWPSPANRAIEAMGGLYREKGDEKGVQALKARVAGFRRTSLIP